MDLFYDITRKQQQQQQQQSLLHDVLQIVRCFSSASSM